MATVIHVVEEVIHGQRLLYLDRNDLRFSVEQGVPSEARRAAVDRITGELGLAVVASNFESRELLRVVVKRPVAPKRASSRPTFAPAAGQAEDALRTASGRRR